MYIVFLFTLILIYNPFFFKANDDGDGSNKRNKLQEKGKGLQSCKIKIKLY